MLYLKIFALVIVAFGAHKMAGGITWIPFVLLAGFIFWRDFFSTDDKIALQNTNASVKFGILDEYVVDDEKVYGLYVALHGASVFVDIRRDSLVIEREKLALELFEKQSILENEVTKFLLKHDKFKNDRINSFGIHSDDLNRVEVFWDSGEYTILRNMVFFVD